MNKAKKIWPDDPSELPSTSMLHLRGLMACGLVALASGCSGVDPDSYGDTIEEAYETGGLVELGTDRPLTGDSCLSLDPAMTDEQFDDTLRALEAWGPLPVRVNLMISGDCEHRMIIDNIDDQTVASDYYTGKRGVRIGTAIYLHPELIEKQRCLFAESVLVGVGYFLGLKEASTDPASIMSHQDVPGCTGHGVTTEDRQRLQRLYR